MMLRLARLSGSRRAAALTHTSLSTTAPRHCLPRTAVAATTAARRRVFSSSSAFSSNNDGGGAHAMTNDNPYTVDHDAILGATQNNVDYDDDALLDDDAAFDGFDEATKQMRQDFHLDDDGDGDFGGDATTTTPAAPAKRGPRMITEMGDMADSPLTDPNNIDMDADLRAVLTGKAFNITRMYPIQALTFQQVQAGEDVIGRSRTGTGKTLAFVLPLAQKLMRSGAPVQRGYANVVIIEPTRELANQVAAEIRKLSRKLKVSCIYGGVAYGQQESELRGGVDFLVATPGRLIDHIDR
jgi:hypothetical protein